VYADERLTGAAPRDTRFFGANIHPIRPSVVLHAVAGVDAAIDVAFNPNCLGIQTSIPEFRLRQKGAPNPSRD
jgi:hypothetical protein